MWVLNQLHVIAPQPELDADALVAELDRLYPALAHRRVTHADDATGARLADAMGDRGFRAEHDAVMLLGDPPPPPPAGVARQADEAAFAAAELVLARDDPEQRSVADLLAAGRARMRAARPGTRRFVGRHEGVDACTVTMLSDGDVAQLEDVSTLAAHRGHGVAGATLALAIHEALRSGHELVFLVVDADEGPVALYERLGFAVAGHTWTFSRAA